MKASELIISLQKKIDKKGDLPVGTLMGDRVIGLYMGITDMPVFNNVTQQIENGFMIH